MTTAWDPTQYRTFAAERAAPLHELLALLRPTSGGRLVDLGCGPGELTALVSDHLRASETTGIDNSPSMLAAAAEFANERIQFVDGDIATWTSEGDVDVLLAAASLQWVPDHRAVLANWARSLAPGGQMIVQVPSNAHAATHQIAAALAEEEPFRSAFGDAGPPVDPVATNVLRPHDYASVLFDLGFTEQHVMLRVYPHVLESVNAAVEWVKGTTLTRFAAVLPPATYDEFLTVFEQRLTATLGDRRPLFFPFDRILFWARRSP